MTLPIDISAGASPLSDDSIIQPRTPESPALGASSKSSNSTNNSNNKRKPSRRANTAERRATHNAVERQRRETLNGRFLDLAALLPNLSQIRRPSKSSIVNSSIAHVHASRRHRILSSRELRLLKLETDSLRRELNEWRDRAGVPRVEEPVRGEGFSMVLSGELEVLPISGMEDGDEDGEYGYGDEMDGPMGEDMYRDDGPPTARPQMIQRTSSHGPVATPSLANLNLNRLDHSGAMIASPTSIAFDSPAIPGLYESQIPSVASMNTMGGMGMNMNMSTGMGNGSYHGQGQMSMGMGMGMDMQGRGQQGHYPANVNGHNHGFEDHSANTKGFNPEQAYLASLNLARSRSGSVASASSTQSIGLAMRSRGRSGSMSTTSSRGSASPSHPQLAYGGSQEGNEWMQAQGMNGGMSRMMGHGNGGMVNGGMVNGGMVNGGMVNGGMGGMGGMGNGAGVAFAMMM